MNFKLTYATMFNPPADMHAQFDAALVELNASLGGTHTLYIDGKDRDSAMNDARRSPIDQRRILGHFSLATVDDVDHAMAAAQAAFQSWRATPMAERVGLLKRVATQPWRWKSARTEWKRWARCRRRRIFSTCTLTILFDTMVSIVVCLMIRYQISVRVIGA